MSDFEDLSEPFPGETHIVSHENLTVEQARQQLESFVQKIHPGSMSGQDDCGFAMDENTKVETRSPGPRPSKAEAQRRAAMAAEQAAIETGEIPDVQYSVHDAIRIIRAKVYGLQAALTLLEEALYPKPLPDVLEDSVAE